MLEYTVGPKRNIYLRQIHKEGGALTRGRAVTVNMFSKKENTRRRARQRSTAGKQTD